jgi:hypothetical protein
VGDKLKVLVVGYMRSGTTLMRRIVQFHPDIVGMLHEKRIIKRRHTKEAAVKYAQNFRAACSLTNSWGEKVPFYGKTRILPYCRKWVKLFGNEARIIHIVRHPIDVAISNVKKVKSPAKSVEKAIALYRSVYPRLLQETRDDEILSKKTFIISFETLVTKPEKTLEALFKFCNLNSDHKIIKEICEAKDKKFRHFDGINSDRAFAYKKTKYKNLKVAYDSIRRYEV